MNLVEHIRTFIGVPPVGFEYLEYAFGGLFFLLLINMVTDLFRVIAGFMRLR